MNSSGPFSVNVALSLVSESKSMLVALNEKDVADEDTEDDLKCAKAPVVAVPPPNLVPAAAATK